MSSHYRRIVLAVVLAAGFWPGSAHAGVPQAVVEGLQVALAGAE